MRKILFATAAAFLCWTCGGQQIYNMSFDHWSRQGVSWNPFPDGAGMRQRVWDTANRGLRPLGINVTTPEREHVAVAGRHFRPTGRIVTVRSKAVGRAR